MSVTIKDVAKASGLSISTVSIVLNNKPHSRIPQATCKRVMETARQLNYRPNRLAVGLITKRTKIIGLIVPDISNQYFAQIAAAAERAAEAQGYSIMLCNTNDNPDKDIAYTHTLLERGIDGILFTMSVNARSNRAEECLSILRGAGVPLVLIDRLVENDSQELSFVTTDDEESGYIATKHLIDLGHRHIGCITGAMGDQSAKKRLFGYIKALQEGGIAFNPALVAEGDYHTTSGFEAAGVLIEQHVSAIFSHNDMMALGAYKRLLQAGLKTPEDVSLIGIDNLDFTEFLEVPFSTVERTPGKMGEWAVSKMIQLLGGEDAQPEKLMYSPQLVVRKSTAAPKY